MENEIIETELTDEEVISDLEKMPEEVEELRNKLNSEIRVVLSLVDMIDGKTRDYENYEKNTLIEKDYLSQQLDLVSEVKERLIDIYK